MCGISAYSGKVNKVCNPYKIKLLMFYNEDRGKDSSGIYSLANGGITKSLGKTSASLLVDTEILPDNLIIGHTRQPSRGTSNLANTHPFELENTVLVHNGTIDNVYDICKEEDWNYDAGKADSRYILDLFIKHKKAKIVIPKLEGIANLIIHDKNKPNIFYVYKHPMRPLYKGKCDEGLYISSTKEGLQAIDCINIEEFKDHYFYTVENGVVKGSPLHIKMKEKVYTPTRYYDYENYGDEWPADSAGSSQLNLNNLAVATYRGYSSNRLVKYIGPTRHIDMWMGVPEQRLELKKNDIYTIMMGLTKPSDVSCTLYLDYNYNKTCYENPTALISRVDLLANERPVKGDLVEVAFKVDVEQFTGKEYDEGTTTLYKNEILLVVQEYNKTQDKALGGPHDKEKLTGFLAVRITDLKEFLNDSHKFNVDYVYCTEMNCWTLDTLEKDIMLDSFKVNKNDINKFLNSIGNADVKNMEFKFYGSNVKEEIVNEDEVIWAKGTVVTDNHFELYKVAKDYTIRQLNHGITVELKEMRENSDQYTTIFLPFAKLTKQKETMVVNKIDSADNEPKDSDTEEIGNDFERVMSPEEKQDILSELDEVIEGFHETLCVIDSLPNTEEKVQIISSLEELKEKFIAHHYDNVDCSIDEEEIREYFNIGLTELDTKE